MNKLHYRRLCYNCNSFSNSFAEEMKFENFNKDMKGVDVGDFTGVNKYFYLKESDKNVD